MLVYDQRGRPVQLGACLGRGAEGSVHRVHGASIGCVKLFDPALRTSERENKIRAMIECRPRGGLLDGSGWPRAMIYEDRALTKFAGFIMVLIDVSAHVELQDTWETNSSFAWATRVAIAANLAAVVAEVHDADHRIGDLRERNVLVNANSQVALVDCDSFEIRDRTGTRFFSGVGTPDYLPPELLFMTHRRGCSLRGIERYYSDLHALAVIVFQLLMNGTHPFSARGPGIDHSLGPRVEKIMAGVYPYVDTGGKYLPPMHAPSIDVVPPLLVDMFRQAFVEGHRDPTRRPTAREWQYALVDAAKSTTLCRVNRNHSYGSHLPSCPWCKALARRKGSGRKRSLARRTRSRALPVGVAVGVLVVVLILWLIA